MDFALLLESLRPACLPASPPLLGDRASAAVAGWSISAPHLHIIIIIIIIVVVVVAAAGSAVRRRLARSCLLYRSRTHGVVGIGALR